MDRRDDLVSTAERLFHRHGYVATGMDRLTEAAGMSSRTLYKHGGSKAAIMAAVLDARGRRFMQRIETGGVDALFLTLGEWLRDEGARGCLFLRARAETGGDTPEIEEAVAAHKTAFAARVREIVAAELGRDDPLLAEQVLVLFEGATHAAVYRGEAAIDAARQAAVLLVERARR